MWSIIFFDRAVRVVLLWIELWLPIRVSVKITEPEWFRFWFQFWPKIPVSVVHYPFQCWSICELALTISLCAKGRVNLYFLVCPYGTAVIILCNLEKYPIKTLNWKNDFKTLKRAKILSFYDKKYIFFIQFLDFWLNFEWNFGATPKNGPNIMDLRP